MKVHPMSKLLSIHVPISLKRRPAPPGLRRHLFTLALSLASGPWAFSVFAQSSDTCAQGYVWREAFAGDHVCVTPRTRAQAASDNSQAAARRQPGGGAYGPNTCLPGWVWRIARTDDLVCVTPEVRAQAAADNAAAGSRRAVPSTAAATPPVVTSSYQTSPWSGWTRASGVEYRYRWGWNTEDKKYAAQVDAIFQLRNMNNDLWHGAARSIDCSGNTLSRSTNVDLRPHETRDVQFLTPNCGTLKQPWFKPNVVRSATY
jgi:hypothetical protein